MLRPLLSPLVDTMLPTWPALGERQRAEVYTHALSNVVDTVRGAPLHIRAALTVLAGLFTASAWLMGRGRSYGRQGTTQQARTLARWTALGAAPRGFERAVRSLTMLAAMEHPHVARAIGLERSEDRAARKRAMRAGRRPARSLVEVG